MYPPFGNVQYFHSYDKIVLNFLKYFSVEENEILKILKKGCFSHSWRKKFTKCKLYAVCIYVYIFIYK